MMQIKQYGNDSNGKSNSRFGITLKNVLRFRRKGNNGSGEQNKPSEGYYQTQLSDEQQTQKSKKKGYISFDKVVKPSTSSNDLRMNQNIRSATYPLKSNSTSENRIYSTENGKREDQVWGPPPVTRSIIHSPGLSTSRNVLMGIELEEDESNQQQQQDSSNKQKRQGRLYSGQNRRPQGSSTEFQRNNHQRFSSEPIRQQSNQFSSPYSQRSTSFETENISSSSSPPTLSSGLKRSSSVTSTTRARPQGKTPTSAELQKRSSQFVGYWCPYPSTVFEDGQESDLIDYFKKDICEDDQKVEDQKGILIDGEISTHTSGMMEEIDDLDGDCVAILPSSIIKETNSPSHKRSPSLNNPSSPNPNSKQSFDNSNSSSSIWAVSRGWKTGIYRTHSEANKQIEGFPGPLIRQFDTQIQAREWLNENVSNAHKIPSIRTLDIDEEFGGKPIKMDKLPNSDSYNSLFRKTFIDHSNSSVFT